MAADVTWRLGQRGGSTAPELDPQKALHAKAALPARKLPCTASTRCDREWAAVATHRKYLKALRTSRAMEGGRCTSSRT